MWQLKESPTSKLLYGVFPLPDYCIYSEMLKYLLENDMVVLEKIHSAVKTPIGYVFRDFVVAMTKKRQEAANLVKAGNVIEGESLKEFAKLNVNSSFGKTIQDDANFDESFVVKTKEQFLKKTVKRKIIDYNVLAPARDDFEGMVELKLKKNEYLIKSPRYLGCSIFWLSKMIVLDFVYNCLYQVYKPENVKVMYMDTDSLYLKFIGEEMPTSYGEFVELFPTHLRVRHFPKDDHDITPGKMKCEKEIAEAVFLRPKCYCLRDYKKKETAKSKGISLKQNEEVLKLENYRKSLNELVQIQGKNIQILKTTPTTMETAEQIKIALTPYDDKRVWYSVSHSEPYGLKEEDYDEAKMLERIVNNCAKRVDLERKQFEEYLGCNVEDFKNQIKNILPDHCSLINYGVIWNIDHRLPLGDKDLKDKEVLRMLCHHTNLKPMRVEENSRKKDKEEIKESKKETKEEVKKEKPEEEKSKERQLFSFSNDFKLF